jgi:anaerobic selenocysteine-containing dehydrogenase
MNTLSRRRFLKISAGTIAGLGAIDATRRVVSAASKVPKSGLQRIPTFCNVCARRRALED